MAHEITSSDTPVYVGKPAWHRLGTVISADEARNMTHVQLAERANMLFDVEAFALDRVLIPNPRFIVPSTDLDAPTAKPKKGAAAEPVVAEPEYLTISVPGWAANVRLDTMEGLACVSEGYAASPNRALAETMDAINAGAHDGRIMDPEAAVTLKGGRLAVLTAKFREPITLPGGDVIEPYLFGATSHNRSMATKFRTCMFRIECNNMLQAGLLATAKLDFTIMHTESHDEQLAAAREALTFALNDVRNFEAEAAKMIEQSVTDEQFFKLVENVIVHRREGKGKEITDRMRQSVEQDRMTIKGLWLTDPRVGNYRGTAWGAVQAVSTWEQHLRPADNQEQRNVLAAIGKGFDFTAAAAKLLVAAR